MNPVTTRLRVRYGETDAMGVVYYANYLTYFEVGRTDFFKAMGLDYAHLEDQGILAPCVEASCRYRSPARYAQELLLTTTLTAMPGVRLVFDYRLDHAASGAVLATGRTVHACVDRAGRPLALKKKHPQAWTLLQQALHEVKHGDCPPGGGR
ncbi:MAG: thioesterase family protein [Bacillota bacterium]